jgi:hypothetical protein
VSSDDEDDCDRYGRYDYDYDIRHYTLKSTKWRQFIFPQEPIIEYLTSEMNDYWRWVDDDIDDADELCEGWLNDDTYYHTIHPFIHI